MPKTLINPKKEHFFCFFITCDIKKVCGSLPDTLMIYVNFFEISPQFGQHLLTKSSLKDVADFSRIWAKNAGFGQKTRFLPKKARFESNGSR